MDDISVKTIECTNEFCIAAVNEFKSNIEEAVSSGNSLIIDVSKVERIDTAALQLLHAIYKHAVSGDIKLEFKQPSNVFSSAARELGLEEILG